MTDDGKLTRFEKTMIALMVLAILYMVEIAVTCFAIYVLISRWTP